MDRFLHGAGQVVAVGLAILFVVITPLVALSNSVEYVLLRSAPYKQALRQQDVYEQAPALLADQIAWLGGGATMGNGVSLVPFLAALATDEWQSVLTALAPPVWLQTETERGLDQFFAFARGDQPTFTPTLETGSLRERLAGPPGFDALNQIVAGLPPCDLGDLIEGVLAGDSLPNLTCRPPDELTAILIESVQAAVVPLLNIPDSTPLTQASWLFDDAPISPLLGNQGVAIARFAVRLSPVLPLFLLVLIPVFGAADWRDGLRWLASPLLLTGILLLLAALLAWPVSEWVLRNNVTPQLLQSVTPALSAIVTDVLRSVRRLFLLVTAAEGVLLILLGLVAGLPSRRW